MEMNEKRKLQVSKEKEIKRKNVPSERNKALQKNFIHIFISVFFLLLFLTLFFYFLFAGKRQNEIIYISLFVFPLASAMMCFVLRMHWKAKKRILRSYCPYCGSPYYYDYHGDMTKDIDSISWNLENAFRNEKKELWKGIITCHCSRCRKESHFSTQFYTYGGENATSAEDPIIRVGINRAIKKLFDKNKIHLRKK